MRETIGQDRLFNNKQIAGRFGNPEARPPRYE